MSLVRARRRSRQVMIGGVSVGGGARISVQSMTNTRTDDVEATSAQIEGLSGAGCEIVRVAVPDRAAAAALPEIVARSRIPVVADIHFDHALGLSAIEAGVHAVRINPGNIGGPERVRAIVEAAREHAVPIRIGVNAGSLERDLLEQKGHPTAEGMVDSCLRHVEFIEALGFHDVILSLKASDVAITVEANRMMAERCDYPLHLGVTEAGTVLSGAVRSAVGLGILLSEGIGDTIRVSLAGPPEEEVRVGRKILESLGLRHGGVTVIACPTCGRCRIDVAAVAEEVERTTAHIRSTLTVAVMGCAVNGPGEAREADVGVAGGAGEAVLFKDGEVVEKVPEAELAGRLLREIRALTESE
jgi:(E)-4-hydroxy-3-methylbut-2-enyl-diphosphate synthase